LERSTSIILLIEDDEFDRTTLTRLLEESGYGVMSTSRRAAADTFAINHHSIALILASAGMTDAERIRLLQSLHRIDAYVPVVVGARRATHRPNSGEDSGRHSVFLALVAEVERRLDVAAAQAAAQAESFAQVQAPAPGAPSAPASASSPASAPAFVFAHDASVHHALPTSTDGAGTADGVFFPDFPDVPPPLWSGSSRLTTVANLDPRNYFRQLSSQRRSRHRRARRIVMMLAAACAAPLIVAPLIQMRPTIARAIAEYAVETPPLASASLSARVGVVPLVSSSHVERSRYADDLGTLSRGKPARNTRK
jgi:CheY-like chemotaxis protein